MKVTKHDGDEYHRDLAGNFNAMPVSLDKMSLLKLFPSLALLFLALVITVFSWLCWQSFTDQSIIESGGCAVVNMDNYPPSLSAEYDHGKQLFRANCAACHAGDMKSNLTGPALAPALKEWQAYPSEDLYAFIRNSQAQIAAGHPRATEVWKEWGPTVMNNFEQLTDEDITAILAYIEAVYR